MSFDNLTNQLITGNCRFSTNRLLHSNQDTSRRIELSSSQKPFTTFLCCSDSRVPPEIIFVYGLGDLFIITRVAGNIITNEVLGSLEYAIEPRSKNYYCTRAQTMWALQACINGRLSWEYWKFSSRHFTHSNKHQDLEGDSVGNTVNENIQLNV